MRSPLRHRVAHLGPLAALALALVLLAGCGGDDEPAADDQAGDDEQAEPADDDADGGEEDSAATFVAVDIDWEEAPSQLSAGETTLVLDNQGDLEHTLVVEGLEGGEPIVETEPGETGEGTMELEPGTYTYYCDVPGHREAGMEGTFEVTE